MTKKGFQQVFASLLIASLVLLSACTKSGGGSDNRSSADGANGASGITTSCGVVVDGELVNPIDTDEGELVTVVDVLSSNLILINDGDQKLVKLHGVSSNTEGTDRNRAANIIASLGSQARFIQPDSDCKVDDQTLIGQLISLSGKSFAEELLSGGAALAEADDVCNGNLISSCYSALEETGLAAAEQDQEDLPSEQDYEEFFNDFFGTSGGSSYTTVYKPVSDSNGRLVIVVSAKYTGDVEGVSVERQGGQKIEDGEDAGVANGGRTHWRFSRAGGSYGNPIVIRVKLYSGKDLILKVANSGSRQEWTHQ